MRVPENLSFGVAERFIRYTAIDTQSDPESTTCPSTEKQRDLAWLLVKELRDLGLKDALCDDNGYVYATIPANSPKKVPVICFCSHMDTSPDCSGAGVKAIIHKNYQGQDLVLPDDKRQVIKMSEHPDLQNQIGDDIITASGTTLLGADNKAGIAEIMEAAKFLVENPAYLHGEIKILFTPDEEIGRGVDRVDLKRLGADYAYTVDGETAGSIENETFSADGLRLIIHGVSSHPGFAKGRMQNALKIASAIIERLPAGLSPEHTDEKQGFVHPVSFSGSVETAQIDLIIRDFDTRKLADHEQLLDQIAREVVQAYPGAAYELIIEEQYRNMKEILDQHPQVVQLGIKAIERAGMPARLQSIRGGTDGSRLSFMGLACPNIFAGEHAFHGKQEWVSVGDMHKAILTILNLALLWEEEAGD